MIRAFLTVAAIWAAFFVSMAQAQQQRPCAPHDDVLTQLAKKYSEIPIARGLSSQGAMIEVLVSPTGSWTILVTNPNGRACIAAVGEGWRSVEQPKPEDTGA